MTQQLRGVLSSASDLAGAGRFEPDELWRKGRRSRTIRLTAVAACLLLVALAVPVTYVLAAAAPNPESVDVPAGAPNGLAIPSKLYSVPGYVEPQSGLRVGPVAAAFLSDSGLPVAVSATNGSYHILRLPGFDAMQVVGPAEPPVVSVSPDGSHILYAWHGPLPAVSGTHVASGVRVLDTVTGQFRTFRVPGGLGQMCGSFSWSPDSRFAVIQCWRQGVLDSHGSVGNGGVVQRLDVAQGRIDRVPLMMSDSSMAVSNRGWVVSASGDVVEAWKPGAVPTHVETQVTAGGLDYGNESVSWEGSEYAWVVGGRHAQVVQVGGHTPFQNGAQERLSGALTAVGTVRPGEYAVLSTGDAGAKVQVVDPTAKYFPPEPAHSVDVAGRIDTSKLTLAVELLRSPTRPTGAPHWPTDWNLVIARTIEIAVVVLLVGGGGLSALWWRRRRRLQRPIPVEERAERSVSG